MDTCEQVTTVSTYRTTGKKGHWRTYSGATRLAPGLSGTEEATVVASFSEVSDSHPGNVCQACHRCGCYASRARNCSHCAPVRGEPKRQRERQELSPRIATNRSVLRVKAGRERNKGERNRDRSRERRKHHRSRSETIRKSRRQMFPLKASSRQAQRVARRTGCTSPPTRLP